MSPELTARYFDCGSQPPLLRSKADAYSCGERAKFAWVICRDSLRVSEERGVLSPKRAQEFAEGIGTLMEMTAMILPASGVGKADLSAMIVGGVIGSATSAAPAMVISWSQPEADPIAMKEAMERERAKLAAGIGSVESLSAAERSIAEFEQQNSEWLGSHPVIKAALQGFVIGALGGLAGHGTSKADAGLNAAIKDSRMAAEAQAQADAKLIELYLAARRLGAFELPRGPQLKTALESKIAARLKELLQTAGEDPAKISEMPPEDQIALLGNKIRPQLRRSGPLIAGKRLTPLEIRKMIEEHDPEFFKDPELLKEPGGLEKLNKLVNDSPQNALEFQRSLEQQGNDRRSIRRFFRRLAKECPAGKAAFLAIAKECGVVFTRSFL